MILCAALKLQKELKEIILPCHRHFNGYHILRDLNINWKNFNIVEGFLTSSGNFLNRTEAYIEANRCGQISAQIRYNKAQKKEDELFSEDLY